MILQTARYLGIGITTLLHILDPAAVILGGAMNFGGADNPIGKKFLTAIVHEIQTRALPVLSSNLSLHFASLGVMPDLLARQELADSLMNNTNGSSLLLRD